MEKRINDIGWQNAGEEAQKRFRLMNDFVSQVADILALFSDTVRARTFEEFVTHEFSDFLGKGL